MAIETPEWVSSAVFYQIFPDRFCRGSVDHAPKGIEWKDWGSPPEEQGYQGGDLYGIADKLDYLKDLGVSALYLNPVFSSASNHRYHTYDYMSVDPLLGGDAALRKLLDEAHRRGMRVVLDGVFNHASRGFWPFHHILENGPESPYIDWFHVEDFPLNPYPRSAEERPNYRAWWSLPALPKFNTDNPGVREYLFNVAEHWVRFGIDGWRLDVPTEIDDDSFWREFRHRVKAVNPDCYICGEIWGEAQRWLQGDQFDAVMNYPMGSAALSYFGARHLRRDYHQNNFEHEPLDAAGLLARFTEVQSWYAEEIQRAQLNLLDSHDTPRGLWLVQDHTPSLCMSLAFLLSIPGAPCIYYGTEMGMSAGNDPHCRGAFPWGVQSAAGSAITACIRKHARARQAFPVMSRGSCHLQAINEDLMVVHRSLGSDRALIVFNRSDETQIFSAGVQSASLFAIDEYGQAGSEKLPESLQLAPYTVACFAGSG